MKHNEKTIWLDKSFAGIPKANIKKVYHEFGNPVEIKGEHAVQRTYNDPDNSFYWKLNTCDGNTVKS